VVNGTKVTPFGTATSTKWKFENKPVHNWETARRFFQGWRQRSLFHSARSEAERALLWQ
jgi:hypothetical protein